MAALLTVTGREIQLTSGRTCVLGRGSDCDVVIEDLACSRRHARITLGKKRRTAFLEDLGSRNGTFINGDRVYDRIQVQDGARIQVGATVYMLSLGGRDLEVDADDDDPGVDTGTVSIERLSFGRDMDPQVMRVMSRAETSRATEFAGQLGSIGVLDVLQLLMSTRRSGRLHIELSTGKASVEVRDGEVVAATHAELEGFQALLLLVRQSTGLYWLVENNEPCRRTVHEPSSILLIELCRAIDEASS